MADNDNVTLDPTLDTGARKYRDARSLERRQNIYRIMTGQAPPSADTDEYRAKLWENIAAMEKLQAQLAAEKEKTGRVNSQLMGNIFLGYARMQAAQVTARGHVDAAKINGLINDIERSVKRVDEQGPIRWSELPNDLMQNISTLDAMTQNVPGGATQISPSNLATFMATVNADLTRLSSSDQRIAGAYMARVEEVTGVDLVDFVSDPGVYSPGTLAQSLPPNMVQLVTTAEEAQLKAMQLRADEEIQQKKNYDQLTRMGVSVPGAEHFVKYANTLIEEFPDLRDKLVSGGYIREDQVGDGGAKPEDIDDFLDEPKRRLYAELDGLERAKDPASVEIFRRLTSSEQFQTWAKDRGYTELPVPDQFQLFLKEWRMANRSNKSTAQRLYDERVLSGKIPGATRLQYIGAKIRSFLRDGGRSQKGAEPTKAAQQVGSNGQDGPQDTVERPAAGTGGAEDEAAEKAKTAPTESSASKSGEVPQWARDFKARPEMKGREVRYNPANNTVEFVTDGRDGERHIVAVDEKGTVVRTGTAKDSTGSSDAADVGFEDLTLGDKTEIPEWVRNVSRAADRSAGERVLYRPDLSAARIYYPGENGREEWVEFGPSGDITAVNGSPPTPQQREEYRGMVEDANGNVSAKPKPAAPAPSVPKPSEGQTQAALYDEAAQQQREAAGDEERNPAGSAESINPESGDEIGPEYAEAVKAAGEAGNTTRRQQGQYQEAPSAPTPPQTPSDRKPSSRKRGSWEQPVDFPTPDEGSLPEAQEGKSSLEGKLLAARTPEERERLRRRYQTIYGLAGV